MHRALFKIENKRITEFFDLLSKFKKEIQSIGNEDVCKYLANQATYYFDFSVYKDTKLKYSPEEMAFRALFESEAVLCKIVLFPPIDNDECLCGVIYASNKEMIKIFFNHSETIQKSDFFNERSEIEGLEATCFGELDYKKQPISDILAKIKPLEIRVTELALNLLYAIFEQENYCRNDSDKSLPNQFNAFLSTDVGNNLLVEKKRHIKEVIKETIVEDDLQKI